MLEKMGLPEKPSLRGNNWVIDASHCQSCSNQFTFLNRKHHCRRCGGLFCGTCTQHRMVLRGQGDSPVRICEPCKKLEEAARFELRYGHKNRAGKGTSKPASRSVDETLNQILANDGKESSRNGTSPDEDDKSLSNDSEMDSSVTPEELRQQALEEKKRHRVLKAEGKSAEALKAFKKGKELERQAAALELQLRKNKKKVLASTSTTDAAHSKEDVKDDSTLRKGKEKDDLTAELIQLGWSDRDINDADKKPAAVSLEGELLNLIGNESSKGGRSKESSGLDKSQVIALKKKALALKREGKLVEAKEELKRAKILEKQIEEQEFLGDDEESDDELSALMRGLDNDDNKRGVSTGFDLDNVGFDLNKFSEFGGDLGFGGNFEVTDDDLHDPEMAATLQSLGWDDESDQPDDMNPEDASASKEALEDEILKLKKEALTQKRAGNLAEAMSLLKKAKTLEKDHETFESVNVVESDTKPAPKSKLTIQKELLGLKRKALALKREGKFEEADDELKKAKILERQLEEIDNPSNISKALGPMPMTMEFDLSSVLAPVEEDVDLTDQDVDDPTYLSVLQNLGWQDGDDDMPVAVAAQASAESSDKTPARKRRRSKGEIQRELLGLKRKALALRRQGQDTEADELLASAKMLEEELSEIEAANQSQPLVDFPESHETPLKRTAEVVSIPEKRQLVSEDAPNSGFPETRVDKAVETLMTEESHENDSFSTPEKRQSVSENATDNKKSPVQEEILSHKRKAVLLKREGKLAEARDELRKAKLLEKTLQEEEEKHEKPETLTVKEEEQSPSQHSTPKPMSSSERFKLQRECLNHKRSAMKLRREGKTDEADAELELARKLESQLEEANPTPATSAADMAGVEDLFDPQLLSALQAIGLQDTPTPPTTTHAAVSKIPAKEEVSSSSSSKSNVSSQERVQLEAQIKGEKMKALNLKRAGKQAEALDALRRAKQMEKKLNLLPV